MPGERRGDTRLHCGPKKVDKARFELGSNCDDSPPRPPPPYKPGRKRFRSGMGNVVVSSPVNDTAYFLVVVVVRLRWRNS